MERIVAIYARVSTEHEAQLSALENQVQYYDDIMAAHPDWKLYKQYIDKGITGTSVAKRKSFMEMMQDAENGCFDLIVTREVSRFARNTVDTLQETRKLKRMGVEVYFTEDNIWTMNDEDGELRLTIMATLAQNESKKTSQRVKAGQMVSFQNAVVYGTGNILGYERDKITKEFRINPEQAETVRLIYKMYIEGMGIRKIQYELEKMGRLTSMGCSNWSSSGISRILRNAFYCGTIVYRKEYVADYLEQKKRKNCGEVEQIVVEGKHEPIISKEDFALVQELLKTKTVKGTKQNYGKRPLEHIWCKKLKCPCGSSFNRKLWTRTPKGGIKYAYQCYAQKATGTIRTRTQKGLSIEGVCDTPVVPEWKLVVMFHMLMTTFWKDRRRVLDIANNLLEQNIHQGINKDNLEKIKQYEGKLKTLKRKMETLVEMRMGGEISKETYLDRKDKLEMEITEIQNKVDEYKDKKEMSEEELKDKIKILEYAMEQDFDFEAQEFPDYIIDAVVKEVIVYKDYFRWKLNLFDEDICCLVEGTAWKPEPAIVDKLPKQVDGDTGCNCRKWEIIRTCVESL